MEFATPAETARFTTAGVFDPEDDLQARVGAIYPQVRAEMMASYPWSWLTARAELTQVPLTEAEGRDDAALAMQVRRRWPYRYRYSVPNPAVGNVRAVYDNLQLSEPRARNDGWTVQGPALYAEFSPAWIEYQSDVAEEAWPQLFENAVTLKLAARLSMSLKEDLPTTRYYEQLAQLAHSDAKRVDAQSHPSRDLPQFDWVDARVSGVGRLPYGGQF